MVEARSQWESRWRRLPFYLAYESHDVSNDDQMALECMKMILADVWKSVTESWDRLIDLSNVHVDCLQDRIYEQPVSALCYKRGIFSLTLYHRPTNLALLSYGQTPATGSKLKDWSLYIRM